MISPLSGKDMTLSYDWRTISFRKEEFEIPFQFYKCEESGEQFTTTELDELNMKMLHHQYRSRHHIPTVQEIVDAREQYELSTARMGEILGFGANTYRLYESGDVPGLPNANLIKLAASPESFKKLVEEWVTGNEKAKQDLLNRIHKIIETHEKNQFGFDFSLYLMGDPLADEFTGYRKPDLERLTEMIVYFAHEVPSYKTKMNKLLFYADFAQYKSAGESISGTRYYAIPYGPVPNSFQSIYERIATDDIIDGLYEGDRLMLTGRKDRPFNSGMFSKTELNVLGKICNEFKHTSPSEIKDISHQEIAWQVNQESKSSIAYHYAFDLKAV